MKCLDVHEGIDPREILNEAANGHAHRGASAFQCFHLHHVADACFEDFAQLRGNHDTLLRQHDAAALRIQQPVQVGVARHAGHCQLA